MKCKKFIKLIMAQGYQRNQAAKIANEAMGRYGTSYKEILENPAFNLEIIFAQKACKALIAFGIAAVNVANVFAKALKTNRYDP